MAALAGSGPVTVETTEWHFPHLSAVPAQHPFPHPDFCQVVLTATATTHADDPETWTDTAGWESKAWLVPLQNTAELTLSAAEQAFLNLLNR